MSKLSIFSVASISLWRKRELEDLVAVWEVSLPEGKFVIEFEHGTTTGKRVIRYINPYF